MSIRGKVVRSSIVIFYLFIGLEIIIMISPFAAYFYAGYGPLLNALYAFPATAWLTGFFLPHAVVSKSSLLNFVNVFDRSFPGLRGQVSPQRCGDRNSVSMDSPSPVSVSRHRRIGPAPVLAALFYPDS